MSTSPGLASHRMNNESISSEAPPPPPSPSLSPSSISSSSSSENSVHLNLFSSSKISSELIKQIKKNIPQSPEGALNYVNEIRSNVLSFIKNNIKNIYTNVVTKREYNTVLQTLSKQLDEYNDFKVLRLVKENIDIELIPLKGQVDMVLKELLPLIMNAISNLTTISIHMPSSINEISILQDWSKKGMTKLIESFMTKGIVFVENTPTLGTFSLYYNIFKEETIKMKERLEALIVHLKNIHFNTDLLKNSIFLAQIQKFTLFFEKELDDLFSEIQKLIDTFKRSTPRHIAMFRYVKKKSFQERQIQRRKTKKVKNKGVTASQDYYSGGNCTTYRRTQKSKRPRTRRNRK